VFGAYPGLRPAGDEERVAAGAGHRAALAIENARLYFESEQRLHELEALYRAMTLHGSLRLNDVLRALADVATDVLHADKSSVHMWDADRRQLVAVAAHGYGPQTTSQPLIPGEDLIIDGLADSEVLVISDAANDPRFASAWMREMIQREAIRAIIGARITVAGQAFGLFAVAFCGPHTPSVDEQRLVQALAQRAGLAIQNAWLEQAQQVATAEERQRLARELHDAVTQTLFSASLIASRPAAVGAGRRSPAARGAAPPTRGAPAEMRTF
jgi:GAF domain-containing protein